MVKVPSSKAPSSAAMKAALKLREKRSEKTTSLRANTEIQPSKDKNARDVRDDQFEASSVPFELPTPVSSVDNAASLRIQSMLGSVTFEQKEPSFSVSVEGKVAHGDLEVSSAEDLAILRGVEKFEGTLSLVDLDLDTLNALTSLREVGALAIENLGALTSLKDLANLQRVDGNLYIGFNDGLNQIGLPALEKIGGALIVEGQLHAREISMPVLSQVEKYAHFTENLALRAIDIGVLKDCEIVVANNFAMKRSGLNSASAVEWSNNQE